MRKTERLYLILAVICIAGGGFVWYHNDANTPEYVILLTVDGARADHFYRVLDSGEFPALAQLAANGVRVTDARTVTLPLTPEAHASLFSGAEPATFKFSAANLRSETIFQVLERAGHPTALIDGKGSRLTGGLSGVSYLYNEQDFRTMDPAQGNIDAMSLLIEVITTKRPTLAFLLMPQTDKMGHDGGGHESSLYHEAMLSVVQQIERLIATLKSEGIWEKTALIITADHGMTGISHQDPSKATNLHIPLILHGPGIKSGVTLESARITQIAPTIAYLFSIKAPNGAKDAVLKPALTLWNPYLCYLVFLGLVLAFMAVRPAIAKHLS